MDIWRGWDLGEIIVRIPYDNWQEYEGGLTTHPILVKTVINVIIYLVGDWMAQVGWGRTRPLLDFDLARTARNGLIGAFFGPLVHYYYDFSDFILPMDVPINRVLKIIMVRRRITAKKSGTLYFTYSRHLHPPPTQDQTIYFVTKCSVYIALVGLLRGDDRDQVVKDVREKIVPIVLRGWKFWPAMHILTYSIIPARHRVLWVNCLDIIWSYILASLTSSSSAPLPPTEPAQLPVSPPPWDQNIGSAAPSLQTVKVPANETETVGGPGGL